MNNDETVLLVLITAAAATLSYTIMNAIIGAFKRKRIIKKIRCAFGVHEPGPLMDAVGGRKVRRCYWCDKVTSEYEVTLNQARKETIRRVH